jgi:probable HAF family extracellular repeat protein
LLLLITIIHSGIIAHAATGTPPPATSTYYQFTTIDLSNLGIGRAQPGHNYPSGINDTGLVPGYYADAGGNNHGFLWQNGTPSTLDSPGWVDTLLGTINNQGVVIGNFDDSVVSHAAAYNVSAQSWTPLPDIPDKPLNSGNAINDQGVALGMAYEGDFSNLTNGVGWTWNGSAYSFFTIPGQSTGNLGIFPLGINNSGQVSGFYADSQGTNHGFIKDGSTINSFDVPGADSTYAGTINNQGEIVGNYTVGNVSHGFLLRGTEFVTIDFPGADSTVLTGNNNHGQFTGYAWQASQNAQLFVATPEQLSLSNTGTNLLISWPVADVSFQLQSTPSLSGPTWSPVVQAPATNGNTVSVLVPNGGTSAFFRLVSAP